MPKCSAFVGFSSGAWQSSGCQCRCIARWIGSVCSPRRRAAARRTVSRRPIWDVPNVATCYLTVGRRSPTIRLSFRRQCSSPVCLQRLCSRARRRLRREFRRKQRTLHRNCRRFGSLIGARRCPRALPRSCRNSTALSGGSFVPGRHRPVISPHRRMRRTGFSKTLRH